MRLDTYLGIVIGDILVSVITLLLSVVETKKAKHAAASSRTNKILLIVYACVFIIVTAIFIGTKDIDKKAAFNQKVEEGYAQMQSFHFLEAAALFNQASREAYNVKSYSEAHYWQGSNYLLYAIYNNDSLYYHNAANCFLDILEHYSKNSTEYYLDAVSGLCEVYRGLEYDLNNPEYQYWINWLENNIDFSKTDQLSHTENAQKLTASFVLGEYYMACADRQLDPYEKSELAAKAAQYYLVYVDLFDKNSANTGIKAG